MKRNTQAYGFDPRRIVLTGRSAGSHLALIAGIHGDQDQAVPYDHAPRLHAALAKAGVPNRLYSLPG